MSHEHVIFKIQISTMSTSFKAGKAKNIVSTERVDCQPLAKEENSKR